MVAPMRKVMNERQCSANTVLRMVQGLTGDPCSFSKVYLLLHIVGSRRTFKFIGGLGRLSIPTLMVIIDRKPREGKLACGLNGS
jgi:hypothetical protein